MTYIKGKIRYAALACAAALALLCGCRREDWRETVLDIPGLNETNRAEVSAALGKYEGVDKASIKYDFANKKATVRYDSMKVAQTNLRMAIEAKGVEVAYPETTKSHAGYINTRR